MTLTTYKEGSGCESSILPQTLYKKLLHFLARIISGYTTRGSDSRGGFFPQYTFGLFFQNTLNNAMPWKNNLLNFLFPYILVTLSGDHARALIHAALLETRIILRLLATHKNVWDALSLIHDSLIQIRDLLGLKFMSVISKL